MGYEVKLIVGHFTTPRPEMARVKTLKRDGDTLWYPYKRGKNKEFIPSGRLESIMIEVATMDLCKCAYGAFGKLVTDNEKAAKEADQNIVYKWWRDGNTTVEEDQYGSRKIPVPIKDVITALEKSEKEEDSYHRFKWAIAMLKSMQENSDAWDLKVILFGH